MKKTKKNGRPRYAHLGDNCTENNTEHFLLLRLWGDLVFLVCPPFGVKGKDKLQQ